MKTAGAIVLGIIIIIAAILFAVCILFPEIINHE